MLAPQPGERVLDACAAPGGKTGHLLELQPELAELVAVDVSPERLTRIADNLQRLGLSATLVAGDAAEPAGWWDGRPFDRILLDVPCSATGVIRRHPDIKLLRRADDIAALAAQAVAAAARVLAAACAGRAAALRELLGPAGRNRGGRRGIPDARPHARDVTRDATAGSGAATADRHAIAAGTAGMDGFYYACLEKTERTT